MISNILKLFTKEEYTQKNSEEVRIEQEECLPCIASSAAVLTVLGGYLASGIAFKGKKVSPNLSVRYMNGMKYAGFVLLPLGLLRAFQGYHVYRDQQNKGRE